MHAYRQTCSNIHHTIVTCCLLQHGKCFAIINSPPALLLQARESVSVCPIRFSFHSFDDTRFDHEVVNEVVQHELKTGRGSYYCRPNFRSEDWGGETLCIRLVCCHCFLWLTRSLTKKHQQSCKTESLTLWKSSVWLYRLPIREHTQKHLSYLWMKIVWRQSFRVLGQFGLARC